jgi:hypothetical protein
LPAADLSPVGDPTDAPGAGVPLASKGGEEAMFVLTVFGVPTKVLIKGSTRIQFSGAYYGYTPQRGIGSGSRITCTGEGFSIAGAASGAAT